MPDPGPPARAKVVAALLAVYIIWGSTYLGIRIVVETIPPFLSAGMRFSLAGGALYLIAKLQGAPSPSRDAWKPAAITGGLLLLGGNGLVSWAEQSVPSSLTAILIAIVPLWVVVIDFALPGHLRPSQGVLAGIALGLVGVAILVDPWQAGVEHIEPVGAAVLIAASAIWSVGTIYGGRVKLKEAPLLVIGMEMLAGGLILLAAGTLAGEWSAFDLGRVSQRSALAFVYLVLVGAMVGFTAYLWLIKNVPPALATTYAFVNPVVAIYVGWLVLAEPVTPRTLLAAAVIIAGVALITQARSRKSVPNMSAGGALAGGTETSPLRGASK